jgi:NTP pyrophosphatase (non-canonical NTP hydrolase)
LATLNDVQQEVNRQIIRDYGDIVTERLRTNISLGLAEEAGEVAGLMKRVLRNFPQDRERATKENFINEMGDVLWYLTACCQVQGTSLEEIWEYNIQKLKARYKE